jgi:hypothetical protein
MRRCSNGHEVADGNFQFCPICGEQLESETPVEEPPAQPPEVAEAFGPTTTAAEAFGETPPSAPPPPDANPPPAKWPVSVGWTIVIAIVTALTGLLALLAIYLWRGGHKTAAGFAAAVFALFAIGVIASIAGSGNKAPTTPVPLAGATTITTTTHAKPCSSFTGTKPRSCISKTGIACSGYGSAKPNDCYSAAQLRARVAARKAQLLAAARERKRAAAAAKARAAVIAAANAWHKGYTQQDANVYWKWVTGQSCQDYATNGCWHVAVITRDGCPSYVAVNANEYQNRAIVNSLLDNQGYGIPPQTERVFELDADANGVTANDVQIDCS